MKPMSNLANKQRLSSSEGPPRPWKALSSPGVERQQATLINGPRSYVWSDMMIARGVEDCSAGTGAETTPPPAHFRPFF